MIKTVRICDVCGKEVQAEKFQRLTMSTKAVDIAKQGFMMEKDVDICTDCIDKFKEFVKVKHG